MFTWKPQPGVKNKKVLLTCFCFSSCHLGPWWSAVCSMVRRLGWALFLSPHSQTLRPGHAATVRHLGGFPLQRSFLYQGFLLLRTRAAGIHQQLSPDWRGSTPSSSFSCSSSPPTSLLETTHTHTVTACIPPSSWCLTPYNVSLLPCLLLLQICPSSILDEPNNQHSLWLEACSVHSIFSLTVQMQITVTVTVISKSWPSHPMGVCVFAVWKRDAWWKQTLFALWAFGCLSLGEKNPHQLQCSLKGKANQRKLT